MENLNALIDLAKSKAGSFKGEYFIPKSWNCIGYKDYGIDEKRPQEIKINPYDFFTACAENIIETSKSSDIDLKKSDIKEEVIYGILPRAFTSWKHDDSGKIYPGTLMKTIMTLQMLKNYQVSLLYMLPTFKSAERYNKGELSCPYAIKDIYKVDPNLHDSLFGECSDKLLKTEFKALIEACHMLGIKVVVDFVFRTVSRDNVLVEKHPEWFYWIKTEFSEDFKPPKIGDGKKLQGVNKKTVKQLYNSPDLKRYLSQFTLPPNEIDPKLWEAVKSDKNGDLSERIEKSFGITVMPGFSDCFNDPQPAWTDVTYLKFYHDNAPEIQKKISKDQPPYIMQDGASLSMFHGEDKNTELWDYVIGTLPYYKTNYGIDGARIDMAHALPTELNAAMIKKIKEVDSNFILWSEELDTAKGEQAKKEGFDVISGITYTDYKSVKKSRFNRAIFEDNFLKSSIPLVGSVETADTPRCAYKQQNSQVVKVLFILNAFMPNSVPYINCAQELLEIQPMNLGLDNNENGKYVLAKDDPMYGKLAFFDNYYFHWDKDCEWFKQVIRDVMKIRQNNIKVIEDKNNFIRQPELYGNKKLTAICYYDEKTAKGLFVIANRSDKSKAIASIDKHLPVALYPSFNASIVYDKNGICKKAITTDTDLIMEPCEVDIIEFENYSGRIQHDDK